MENLLKPIRESFSQESPASSEMATSFCEIVHILNKLIFSKNLDQAQRKAILPLRELCQQAPDSVWFGADDDQSIPASTAVASVKRMGDKTAEPSTDIEPSPKSDPSGHEDDLLQQWKKDSEYAREHDYARPKDPADNSAELSLVLYLLRLRLPAEYVVDFDASIDSCKQQEWIRKSCGQAAWERHRALLDPLANVLTLLERDKDNLRLSLFDIHRHDNLDSHAIEFRNEFLSRITERLEALKKHTKATTAPPAIEELKALVDVLETVRAVTYPYIPALDSWWANNATTADGHVNAEFTRAGIDYQFKSFTGPYSSRGLTNPEQDIAVNRPQWATLPKQVLWMLRPYIKFPEWEQRGRVIYANK